MVNAEVTSTRARQIEPFRAQRNRRVLGTYWDHLHNHGFLHVEGVLWRLSPAFDVNPFPDRARELKTWISEDVGPEASIDALMNTAGYFGLSPTRAAATLGEVERRARGGTASHDHVKR